MSDGSPPPNLAMAIELPPEKVAFIEGYLKVDVKKKKRAKKERLGAAWDGFLRNLARTKDIIDVVQRIVASKADQDFVNQQRGAISSVLAAISAAKVNNLKSAVKVIEAANAKMKAHYDTAIEFLNNERSDGRDIDLEDQIAREKAKTHAFCQTTARSFDTALQVVQDKIKESSGSSNVSLGLSGPFYSEMRVLRKRVEVIPQRGDTANLKDAKTALAAIEKDAEQLLKGVDGDMSSTGALGQVKDVSSDPRLAFFAKGLKRKAELDGERAKLTELLEKMDRWDCADLPALRSEEDAIAKRTAAAFQPLKQIDASKISDLEKEQAALVTDVKALIRRAAAVLEAEQELFEQPKRALEQQLAQLEARMAAVRKKVDKEQRAPMETYLAALRSAITGLGGCNLDALKPAEAMMPQAMQMVGHAEHISEINDAIKTAIGKANTVAKGFEGKTDPLAAKAREMRGEMAAFIKSYKTLPVNEALLQAEGHLKEAEEQSAKNTTLVNRRASIQTKIDALETKLSTFNALFKKFLAHGNVPESDYQGSMRGDLDTCISWNKTKTEPSFYSTIEAKLTRLDSEIDEKSATMTAFMSKDYTQMQLTSLAAQEAVKAKEQEILTETDAEALKALQDELAGLKVDFAEKSKELDLLNTYNKEIEARIAEDNKEKAARASYLEKAGAFLKAVKAELKDKSSVLRAYSDEVVPQIKRVEDSYTLVQKDKPGATGQTGLSELAFVEKFLVGVRNRGAKTDKGDLSKISAQWREEIAKLDTAKTALIKEIETFETTFADGNRDVSSAVSSSLNTVFARAAATAFGLAGNNMATAEDKQAVKAARELALAEVRRIRALLFDDKLFQKCVLNPFSVPIGSTAANRLDEIELNVLRGV